MLKLGRVKSVLKEHKILVKKDSESKNLMSCQLLKQKILQRVRFQIKSLTTPLILKQKFHNVSDFKSKKLQPVRLFLNFFFKIKL